MRFEDCYPPEIVEWAQGLPEPECCTPAQKRIAAILEDDEVIKASKCIFEKWTTRPTAMKPYNGSTVS